MDEVLTITRIWASLEAGLGLGFGALLVWLLSRIGATRRKGRLKTDIAGDILAVQYDLYARANLQPWKEDEARYEWMLTPLLREIDRARRIIETEALSGQASAAAMEYHAAMRRFVSKWAGTKRRRKGEGSFWALYDETETAAIALVAALRRSARYRRLITDLKAQAKPEDGDTQRPFQSLDGETGPDAPTRTALS
ncbi:MAG: hypothetical protein AAFX09_06465 [Pseudomonadota bacterium]